MQDPTPHPLHGEQTRLAVQNFRLSDRRFGRDFIRALGLIKWAAARCNAELGLLDRERSEAIAAAASAVADGVHDDAFTVDVFQTGSGTSTNMNANEVIANLAARRVDRDVHPNDHVNLGQSSNDVIPTALRVAACEALRARLLPALGHLHDVIDRRARECGEVVKSGRTHLMDAVPIRLAQELDTWAAQVASAMAALEGRLAEMGRLPIGGTAVGSGLNAHPRFGQSVAAMLTERTGIALSALANPAEAMAAQDAPLRLSGDLRAAAVTLLKVSSDLRWMASGPAAGLGEIHLAASQSGSSIMPGKVNPVGAEACAQAAVQVIGNDTAVATGAQYGNFQLNLMLPLIAHNLQDSIGLLATAAVTLADSTVAPMQVRDAHIREVLARNPSLVTALNPLIGYERGAAIVAEALRSGRTIRTVAEEQTDLDGRSLDRLLDPALLAGGGLLTGDGER